MTNPIRLLSRAALGAIFIDSGQAALREPGERWRAAAKIGVPNPQLAVKANAANMVLAGTALTLGFAPRLAAAALAGVMVPTTYAGHSFWSEESPDRRKQQQIHFMKNLAIIGGLLAVVVDENT